MKVKQSVSWTNGRKSRFFSLPSFYSWVCHPLPERFQVLPGDDDDTVTSSSHGPKVHRNGETGDWLFVCVWLADPDLTAVRNKKSSQLKLVCSACFVCGHAVWCPIVKGAELSY